VTRLSASYPKVAVWLWFTDRDATRKLESNVRLTVPETSPDQVVCSRRGPSKVKPTVWPLVELTSSTRPVWLS
jgi:hypothetical protein